MLGRAVTESEADYALWTQRTPHYVVSTTLEKVSWETAHLVRDVSELRSLKEQPGGAVYVIGGATLVASLLNEGLIDEVRLIVTWVKSRSDSGCRVGCLPRCVACHYPRGTAAACR